MSPRLALLGVLLLLAAYGGCVSVTLSAAPYTQQSQSAQPYTQQSTHQQSTQEQGKDGGQ